MGKIIGTEANQHNDTWEVRAVGQRVLFNKQDIYDFAESQKAKLKEAYARLPDEQALNQEYTEEMKKKFSLQVPTLRPDQWNADDGPTETVIYVPFDGDPAAFDIAPSANNGTIATGEIVEDELLLRSAKVMNSTWRSMPSEKLRSSSGTSTISAAPWNT